MKLAVLFVCTWLSAHAFMLPPLPSAGPTSTALRGTGDGGTNGLLDAIGTVLDKKLEPIITTQKEQGKQLVVLTETQKEQGKQLVVLTETQKEHGKQLKEQGKQLKEQGKQLKEQGKQLEDHTRQLSRLDRKLGVLMESDARKYAERQFGESYSKSLLARSIQDLAYVFPEEVIKTGVFAGETIRRRAELISGAVKALVEQQVPRRLLHCASVKLQATRWFDDCGHLDAKALGKYIGECGDTALRLSLKRLRDCVALDADGQAQELMRCESAGMMCLTAAAHPDLYLTEDDKAFVMPPEKLEFDLRGRVDVASNGHFVYIDVGEVKSALAYREAVKQLGLRLGALKWLITTCVPSADPDVRLVGRLFVSEAGLQPGDRDVIDNEQRAVAVDTWGYSLYLHTF